MKFHIFRESIFLFIYVLYISIAFVCIVYYFQLQAYFTEWTCRWRLYTITLYKSNQMCQDRNLRQESITQLKFCMFCHVLIRVSVHLLKNYRVIANFFFAKQRSNQILISRFNECIIIPVARRDRTNDNGHMFIRLCRFPRYGWSMGCGLDHPYPMTNHSRHTLRQWAARSVAIDKFTRWLTPWYQPSAHHWGRVWYLTWAGVNQPFLWSYWPDLWRSWPTMRTDL